MLPHDLDSFLKDNRIKLDHWQSSNISWDDLLLIGQDHEQQRTALEASATSLASLIQRFSGVHSVRWRVKDSSHVMAKIVRKRAGKVAKYMNISLANYYELMDDLVGLRALHLFKNDCFEIHREVRAFFALKEQPIAYIREGDNHELLKQYEEAGMAVETHKDNYRSIHYILTTKPTLRIVNAELQVRTIFEEGWSEIDHKVRYPNFPNNSALNGMLNLLNGMAGQADYTGGLIQNVSRDLQADIRENSGAVGTDVHHGDGVDQVPETPESAPPSPTGNDDHLKATQSSISAGRQPLPTVEIAIPPPTTTTPTIQNRLDKHNAAMSVLKEINELGVAHRALEARNTVTKTIVDHNQIGATIKAMDEHNAAMRALSGINQVGAVARAMDEQKAAAWAVSDFNRIGSAVSPVGRHDLLAQTLKQQEAAKKILEEHNAVKRVLEEHDAARKALGEYDAVKKALEEHDAVRKALDEYNTAKNLLDEYDAIRNQLKR